MSARGPLRSPSVGGFGSMFRESRGRCGTHPLQHRVHPLGAEGFAHMIPTPMFRRGNYSSGDDFVLEYGELRFTFNERDFRERCEQAAGKLGFLDGDGRGGRSRGPDQPRGQRRGLRSRPPPSVNTSTTAGPSSSVRLTARSCTGCVGSSSAAPGWISASRRASSTSAFNEDAAASSTSSPTAAASRSSWRPSPAGIGSPTCAASTRVTRPGLRGEIRVPPPAPLTSAPRSPCSDATGWTAGAGLSSSSRGMVTSR